MVSLLVAAMLAVVSHADSTPPAYHLTCRLIDHRGEHSRFRLTVEGDRFAVDPVEHAYWARGITAAQVVRTDPAALEGTPAGFPIWDRIHFLHGDSQFELSLDVRFNASDADASIELLEAVPDVGRERQAAGACTGGRASTPLNLPSVPRFAPRDGRVGGFTQGRISGTHAYACTIVRPTLELTRFDLEAVYGDQVMMSITGRSGETWPSEPFRIDGIYRASGAPASESYPRGRLVISSFGNHPVRGRRTDLTVHTGHYGSFVTITEEIGRSGRFASTRLIGSGLCGRSAA